MFALLCSPLAPHRVRGGWRQQLAAPIPSPPPPPPRQALRHLLKWGDGLQSAIEVGQFMRDAVLDGEIGHPMIHRLGGILGRDRPGGAAGHLLNLMEECGFSSLVTALPGAVVSHMVKPSTLLRMVIDNFPDRYEQVLGIDEPNLSEFWQKLLPKSEELRAHPCFQGTGPAEWGKSYRSPSMRTLDHTRRNDLRM